MMGSPPSEGLKAKGLPSQPCADGALPVLTSDVEPSALASLLARVEGLGRFADPEDRLTEERAISDVLHDAFPVPPGEWKVIVPPLYTRSLDAALDLTNRFLPGWARELSEQWAGDPPEYRERCWIAILSPPSSAWRGCHEATCPTAPLALLAALLRALADAAEGAPLAPVELGPGKQSQSALSKDTPA